MKKLIILIPTFLIACFAINAQAMTIHGKCDFSDQTFDDLTCFGAANLTGVTIKDELKVYGAATLKQVTVKEIDIKGQATIIDSKITDEAEVYGAATFKKAIVNKLKVKGPLSIQESRVQGKTKVYGPISAAKTTFEDTVIATTDKLKFKQSNIEKTLIIKSSHRSPAVKLIDGSKVADIKFKGKAGVVKHTANSKINGDVVNGKQVLIKTND